MTALEKLAKRLQRISEQPDFTTQMLAKDAQKFLAEHAQEYHDDINRVPLAAPQQPMGAYVVYLSSPAWPQPQAHEDGA